MAVLLCRAGCLCIRVSRVSTRAICIGASATVGTGQSAVFQVHSATSWTENRSITAGRSGVDRVQLDRHIRLDVLSIIYLFIVYE